MSFGTNEIEISYVLLLTDNTWGYSNYGYAKKLKIQIFFYITE